MATALTRPEADKAEKKLGKPCLAIPMLPPGIIVTVFAHLLLIHFGLGLVALGLIALGLGLDLVASVSYTSGLVNIPDPDYSRALLISTPLC